METADSRVWKFLVPTDSDINSMRIQALHQYRKYLNKINGFVFAEASSRPQIELTTSTLHLRMSKMQPGKE